MTKKQERDHKLALLRVTYWKLMAELYRLEVAEKEERISLAYVQVNGYPWKAAIKSVQDICEKRRQKEKAQLKAYYDIRAMGEDP